MKNYVSFRQFHRDQGHGRGGARAPWGRAPRGRGGTGTRGRGRARRGSRTLFLCSSLSRLVCMAFHFLLQPGHVCHAGACTSWLDKSSGIDLEVFAHLVDGKLELVPIHFCGIAVRRRVVGASVCLPIFKHQYKPWPRYRNWILVSAPLPPDEISPAPCVCRP